MSPRSQRAQTGKPGLQGTVKPGLQGTVKPGLQGCRGYQPGHGLG